MQISVECNSSLWTFTSEAASNIKNSKIKIPKIRTSMFKTPTIFDFWY